MKKQEKNIYEKEILEDLNYLLLLFNNGLHEECLNKLNVLHLNLVNLVNVDFVVKVKEYLLNYYMIYGDFSKVEDFYLSCENVFFFKDCYANMLFDHNDLNALELFVTKNREYAYLLGDYHAKFTKDFITSERLYFKNVKYQSSLIRLYELYFSQEKFDKCEVLINAIKKELRFYYEAIYNEILFLNHDLKNFHKIKMINNPNDTEVLQHVEKHFDYENKNGYFFNVFSSRDVYDYCVEYIKRKNPEYNLISLSKIYMIEFDDYIGLSFGIATKTVKLVTTLNDNIITFYPSHTKYGLTNYIKVLSRGFNC